MDGASDIEALKFNLSDLNEDMLHTILELVSDGIWDWNANTGFVYRNPGWYEMLGYPPHSLDNNVLTWENVIHPDDYSRVMALFDDYLNQRAPGYQAEYRCRMRDGTYIWIEDRGYVLARNADGSVARMVGAHRDGHRDGARCLGGAGPSGRKTGGLDAGLPIAESADEPGVRPGPLPLAEIAQLRRLCAAEVGQAVGGALN